MASIPREGIVTAGVDLCQVWAVPGAIAYEPPEHEEILRSRIFRKVGHLFPKTGNILGVQVFDRDRSVPVFIQ